MRGTIAEVGVPILAIVSIFMLITPVPPFILDLLIVLNAGAAFALLLMAVNIPEPVRFGAFPALLLLSVLFRVGLSLGASRFILTTGEAGRVIPALGALVSGQSWAVGLLFFVVLLVVQFVVVTSGASRVAEVAARFTLDAMPGKQMAVDAELNAGLIDEEVAKARRREIEMEADFYGAMDGASRFVRGDAIAAAVILGATAIGGLILGLVRGEG
ncbi:MAG TPA: EscV/YscV/HrcV family type III secretion system export apparatus protein, partial [Armatimonadetes bacterium]|nr:EscV/YscV/HrcV family type III secretion system export apparatus protein [Armatimonadota bacterium]